MEQMNIVIVGHVDHGKSTVIGRLLADTKSLPEGKLQQVKDTCARESKEFEYAFLLDALKDEQSQGITIDSARVFFKTQKRHYIIIDAPGHIEFLKNMISGAARAEAAVLVIDAKEGVQENSKRHAYMLAMLGIKQLIVVVNKIDLVDYSEKVYTEVVSEYKEFLSQIGLEAKAFIPVSAREGDNVAVNTKNLSWFKGMTVLNAIDTFEKEKSLGDKSFRMPVQGVYKFTKQGDDRRIFAGRVESGSIEVGDKVVFLPSNKRSSINSVEEFNAEKKNAVSAGYSTGFTLSEQIYVNRGDITCKEDDLCQVSSLFEASLFWMGREALSLDKEYYLKLGTAKVPVKVKEIKNVLNASNLDNETKNKVERHEVATCVFETLSPIAFDVTGDLQATSRFVIVDNYDISGGGIILSSLEDSQAETRSQVFLREKKWDRGEVTPLQRAERNSQSPKLVLITGPGGKDKVSIAKTVEKKLFESGRDVYFLGIGNLLRGVDSDISKEKRNEHLRRLGEVSHILIDAGLIVIATASDLSEDDLNMLETILGKESIVTVTLDDSLESDLELLDQDSLGANVLKVINLLKFKGVIFDAR